MFVVVVVTICMITVLVLTWHTVLLGRKTRADLARVLADIKKMNA
jgi:hypothetical protein